MSTNLQNEMDCYLYEIERYAIKSLAKLRKSFEASKGRKYDKKFHKHFIRRTEKR